MLTYSYSDFVRIISGAAANITNLSDWEQQLICSMLKIMASGKFRTPTEQQLGFLVAIDAKLILAAERSRKGGNAALDKAMKKADRSREGKTDSRPFAAT